MNEIKKTFFPKMYKKEQMEKMEKENPGTGILYDLLPKIRKLFEGKLQ